MNHDAFEHAPHVVKGFLATLFGFISGEALHQLNELAATFAHVATGIAALSTAVYTAIWIRKGKRKPEETEDQDDPET